VWRDGCEFIEDQPDGPEGCEPLYSWRETPMDVICQTKTRKGLRASDVKLTTGSRSADVIVCGVPTMWAGRLTGKIREHATKVELIPEPGQPWDTIVLTLAKLDNKLWRAPYPELLPAIDLREKRTELPTRDQLQYGEWDVGQTNSEFEITIPIKDDMDWLKPDHLRVAVAENAFSLYVMGQEDRPFLAGETYHRILPREADWRLLKRKMVGTQAIREIKVRLRKESSGQWRDLIKTWYV